MKTSTFLVPFLFFISGNYLFSQSCNGAVEITCDANINSSNFSSGNNYDKGLTGSCHNTPAQYDGNDILYEFTISNPSTLSKVELTSLSADLDLFVLVCSNNRLECRLKSTRNNNLSESISFSTTNPNTTIYVLVDGYNSSQRSNFNLRVTSNGCNETDGGGDGGGNGGTNTTCSNAPTMVCNQTYSSTNRTHNNNFTRSNNSCYNQQSSFNGRDRLYKISVPSNSKLTVDMWNLSADLDLFIFEGCSGNSLGSCAATPSLNPNNNNEKVIVENASGTYYILVDGYNSAQNSDFLIRATCEEDDPPISCIDAEFIQCGRTYNRSNFNTGNNYNFYNYESCMQGYNTGDFNGNDLAFRFSITEESRVTIRMTGLASEQDLDLFLFNACRSDPQYDVVFFAEAGGSTGDCIARSILPFNTGLPLNSSEEIDVELSTGTYYLIVDAEKTTSKSNFRLNIDCNKERFCDDASSLSCGETRNSTTRGESSKFEIGDYDCHSSSNSFNAPDRVFRINKTSNSGRLSISLFSEGSQDLDLFLLDECGETVNCLARSVNSVSGGRTREFIVDADPPIRSGTYYAVVDGPRTSDSDEFRITATCGKLPCSSAEEIECGETIRRNNVNSSNNISAYQLNGTYRGGNTGGERIFYFEVDQTKDVTITLDPTSSNDNLELILLKDCDEYSAIAASTNGTGLTERITRSLSAGRYYVLVEGWDGDEGHFDLTVDWNCCETETDDNCNLISYNYTGSNSSLRYNFRVPNTTPLGSWTARRVGSSSTINLGNSRNETYNFSFAGTYKICYTYTDSEGCPIACCRTIRIEDPFDCDAITKTKNGGKYTLRIGGISSSNVLRWIDDSNGSTIATSTNNISVDVPKFGETADYSVHFYDPSCGCYRICCIRVEGPNCNDADELSCGTTRFFNNSDTGNNFCREDYQNCLSDNGGSEDDYEGNDLFFVITVDKLSNLRIRMEDLDADLDLFLFDRCGGFNDANFSGNSVNFCTNSSTNDGTAREEINILNALGTYYLMVDAKEANVSSSFSLNLECGVMPNSCDVATRLIDNGITIPETIHDDDLELTNLILVDCINDFYDREIPTDARVDVYSYYHDSSIGNFSVSLNEFDDANVSAFVFRSENDESGLCNPRCLGNTAENFFEIDDEDNVDGFHYIIVVGDVGDEYEITLFPVGACDIDNEFITDITIGVSTDLSNESNDFDRVSNNVNAYSECYDGDRTYQGSDKTYRFSTDTVVSINLELTATEDFGLFLYSFSCGESCIASVDADANGLALLDSLFLEPGDYFLIVDKEIGEGDTDFTLRGVVNGEGYVESDNVAFLTVASERFCPAMEDMNHQVNLGRNITLNGQRLNSQDEIAFYAKGSRRPVRSLQFQGGNTRFNLPQDDTTDDLVCGYAPEEEGDANSRDYFTTRIRIRKRGGGSESILAFGRYEGKSYFVGGEVSQVTYFERDINTKPTNFYFGDKFKTAFQQGQDFEVQLYANDPWTIRASSSWIDVPSEYRTGIQSKTIKIEVKESEQLEKRQGFVYAVGPEGETAIFRIEQDGICTRLNLTANAGVPQNISCPGTQIRLNGRVSPERNDLTYSWTARNGGNIVSGRNTLRPYVDAPGTYTLEVRNSDGCTDLSTVTVGGNEPLEARATIQNNSCNGFAEGRISVNPRGGDGDYSYKWSNRSTARTIRNLTAGKYTLTITDGNKCEYVETFEVSEPPSLIVKEVVTGSSCSDRGANIQLEVEGGAGGYTYQWEDESDDSFISGVGAGNYEVLVSDQNGCSKTHEIRVFPTGDIDVEARIVKCSSDTLGSIELLLQNPMDYEYFWTNGANTQYINDVPLGDYGVLVVGENGCISNFDYTITEEDGLYVDAIVEGNSCAPEGATANIVVEGGLPPYQFEWSTGSTTNTSENLLPGEYTVFIQDSNGCTQYDTIQIAATGDIEFDLVKTDVLCYGENTGSTGIIIENAETYDYLWTTGDTTQQLNNLEAGTYDLFISNKLGCVTETSIVVEEADEIATSYLIVDASCQEEDGAIDMSVLGGTPPYQFLWEDGETTEDIENLASGEYLVSITDQNDCSIISSAVVESSSDLVIEIDDIDHISGDNELGFIEVTVNGGTMPYRYSWFRNDFYFSSKEDLYDIPEGNYYLEVRDATGCKIKSVTIAILSFKPDRPGLDVPVQIAKIASLEIYPNPSDGWFNLNTNVEGKINLTLRNQLGQVVWTKSNFIFTEDDAALDFSEYQSGVYFLNLQLGEVALTKKIIIAR
ncbi:MAG: pre-peptidase C-terminal domain-containing protein [Bacteroidota bacterium]